MMLFHSIHMKKCMDNVVGQIGIDKAFGNICIITGLDPYCDNTVDVMFLAGKWKGVRVPFPLSSLNVIKFNKFFKRLYKTSLIT